MARTSVPEKRSEGESPRVAAELACPRCGEDRGCRLFGAVEGARGIVCGSCGADYVPGEDPHDDPEEEAVAVGLDMLLGPLPLGAYTISVWNCRAAVSRRVPVGPASWSYEAATNWEALESEAIEAVDAQGGAVNVSGQYDCPEELAARAVWESPEEAGDYVHEYIDRYGRRRWVVAAFRDGRFYAPQRPECVKLTGCHTIFGPLEYVAGNAYTYRRRRDALQRARIEYPHLQGPG